jgi:hypothetical protein
MADPQFKATQDWFDTLRRAGVPTEQWPATVEQFYAYRDGKAGNLPDATRRMFEDYNRKHGLTLDGILKQNAKSREEQEVTRVPAPQQAREAPAAQATPQPAPQSPPVVPEARPQAQPQGAAQPNPNWWDKYPDAQPAQPAPQSAAPQPPTSGNWWDKYPDAKPAAKSRSWSDVPGEAISNIPESAGKFAKSIVEPFLSPIETIGNLGDVAAGALRGGARAILPTQVFNALDSGTTPETAARMDQKTGAVADELGKRYGSMEGLKNTLATDPIGALADASLILTAGGSAAARAPGMIGQAGERIAQVGQKIDPLVNTVKGIGYAAPVMAETAGVLTGAGARPFKEAYKAGENGNVAFTENMRGVRPASDAIDMAENAVTQMGKERSDAYTAGMAGVKGSQAQVDLSPLQQSLGEASSMTHYNGIVKDVAAETAVKNMTDKIMEFNRLDPQFQTPAALDALKQSLGEMFARTQQGTLERTVVGKVLNGAKSEITRQAPEYAKTMSDYANASDNIKEMRRTMSVSDKAMPDTTLRKLQSTMRNNVNTNYGQREKLLDTLARHEPDLPAALAGQSLNTWAPRGLARATPGMVVGGGAAMMAPQALAMLPLTSPRLMGEIAYGAGRVGGATGNAFSNYGMSPEIMSAMARGSYAGGQVSNAFEERNR